MARDLLQEQLSFAWGAQQCPVAVGDIDICDYINMCVYIQDLLGL